MTKEEWQEQIKQSELCSNYGGFCKERQMDEAFERTFHQVVRNQTLEEVAREFDKMRFGDTSVSFATFVRNMKR
jgi:hypothetical protein